MKNPDQEYDRLHDHMTAIARERDHAVRTIDMSRTVWLALALTVLCAALMVRSDRK